MHSRWLHSLITGAIKLGAVTISEIVTTLGDPGSDTKLVTEKAIRTAVAAAGGGVVFVPRGADSAANDYGVGDFTTDGTWRDLDLSAIVPAGAIAVYLKMVLKDDAASSVMSFRENGNANAIESIAAGTQVANVNIYLNGIVACDANRVIEYMGTNTTFSTINVYVMGWWV